MLSLFEAQEPRPHQRTAREIERHPRLVFRASTRFDFTFGYGERVQVFDEQLDAELRVDDLSWLALDDLEARAQNLVPAYDLVERGAQCRDVQRSFEAQHVRDVVTRRLRQQAIEQP